MNEEQNNYQEKYEEVYENYLKLKTNWLKLLEENNKLQTQLSLEKLKRENAELTLKNAKLEFQLLM